eukprot:augustus_masked-scaffold_7-processed-gene-19.107-mRNA-1 protein AED:0.01 eAED:0.01 QI:0/-1/0/1/-1/1/1/0/382
MKRFLSTASYKDIPAFQSLVGNTSLVYLKSFSEQTGCNIFGKCEYENPGGSIKDRAALKMILGAEERGELVRGQEGLIIEGTAGNTGIGLALASRIFGYKCVIVIANTNSQEKKNVLRWAGAHLVEVAAVPYKNENNYVHVAERISNNLKDQGVKAFYANQWDNLDNKKAHFQTGKEILDDVAKLTGEKVDAFSCAAGTGGTIAGIADIMRRESPDTKIFLTDPQGAGLVSYFHTGELRSNGSSISEGVGQNRITGNLEGFEPSGCFEITDTEMINALNQLQEKEGLAVGSSAGINVAGTLKVAEHLGFGSRRNIVTVLCDMGQRYASKIYSEQFLVGKGLPVAPWLRNKEDLRFAHEYEDEEGIEYFEEQIKKATEMALNP